MAERPYVAEVYRGLLRRGSQGRKRGKLTLIARMDRGHGGRGPFSLTEEDDDDDEDLLTDEDAMSQDKEEQQLWPDMCSPCRPFFKYHGPGPDQGSPGAMAICHVVVAEKDEGESKRGCRGVGPVLVTKVDKPQMIEEENAVRDSESDPTNEEDGLSHPVGKKLAP